MTRAELAKLIKEKSDEIGALNITFSRHRDLTADRSDPACCPKCLSLHGSFPCPPEMAIRVLVKHDPR